LGAIPQVEARAATQARTAAIDSSPFLRLTSGMPQINRASSNPPYLTDVKGLLSSNQSFEKPAACASMAADEVN
jgi:hypothetical protein